MKQNAALPGNLTDFFDRLDCPNLVISVHHTNQDSIPANSAVDFLRIDQTVLIDREISNPEAEPFFKVTACIQDSRMFDTRGKDVLPFMSISQGGADYGLIIALAAAAGKNNFIRQGADKSCYLLPSAFYSSFSKLSVAVAGGRIAEMLPQVGKHRISDSRVDWGCRVIVKIDRFH